MSKTRTEIQFKVVSILVGGDVGFDPSPEDAETVDGYIDSEVAELNADGAAYISDPDNLDDELFVPFCKLVANAAAEEFGGKSDEGMARTQRNIIKRLSAQKPGYGPQETSYF